MTTPGKPFVTYVSSSLPEEHQKEHVENDQFDKPPSDIASQHVNHVNERQCNNSLTLPKPEGLISKT